MYSSRSIGVNVDSVIVRDAMAWSLTVMATLL